MQKELVIQKQQMSVAEISTIADAFVKSGMFTDTKHVAQAIVKIQAGQEVGIKPFAAMTGIHIIMGKPVIGAGIISSRIKASEKYDYIVKEMTDKVCSIDFYQGKKIIGNSTFTIEDARKAQTKNIDKFPKNMLFARAISNGVKWFAPDVFDGPVYVPEEMDIAKDGVDIEDAEVIESIEESIAKLENCNSVKELAMLKETLSQSTIKDKRFIEAAKQRYEAVK